jgi:hypothetical protein
MATRTTRSSNGQATGAASAAENGAAPPLAGAEMARQQLVLAAQSMAHWCRTVERFQQAQQHLAQRASLLHSQAADNLRKATSPMELASIQGTLLVYQWQEGARFLQELMVVGASAGREGELPDVDNAADNPAAAAAQAATNAALSAAGPMVQAWQQLFTPPQDGERPH